MAETPEATPRSETNPYLESTALQKLKARQEKDLPLKIAFLDIDSTLTGIGNPESTNAARRKLEDLGYVICFVSSRTEEMVMSSGEYEKSQALGFTRPAAHLKKEDGKFSQAPNQEVIPTGILDPDIIAGETGSTILIHQKTGGYEPDFSFEKQADQKPNQWRPEALRLIEPVLKKIDPTGQSISLSPLESARNFNQGLTDVFPPDFRIQLNITSEEQKEAFIKELADLRTGDNPDIKKTLLNIRVTDDSNPQNSRFSVYITPHQGYKARAIETIYNQLVRNLGINRDQIDALFCGDSFPDLNMGLYSAIGSNATFLVVGGSRLAAPLTNPEDKDFANEGIMAIKKRLTPQDEKGKYTFKAPLVGKRTVIIGDQSYPGKLGPDSILAYLNS